jgi:hypothetical protein
MTTHWHRPVEKYRPQVGDLIKLSNWKSDDIVEVLYVGNRIMLTRDTKTGYESSFGIDVNEWIKVEKPIPLMEIWGNIYSGSSDIVTHSSLAAANRTADSDRLAILHIYTDADGVDQAEITRITQ